MLSMLSSQVIRRFSERAVAPPRGGARAGRGFTLIEVLIVVVIVTILAAFAYPSYRNQVYKTRRADAKAVLMQDAQFLERRYTEYGCYNPDTSGATPCAKAGSVDLPYDNSPIDGATKYYCICLAEVTASTFTLTASEKGAECPAKCPAKDAESTAAPLTLDNAGARTGWDN